MTISDAMQMAALFAVVIGVGLLVAAFLALTAAIGAACIVAALVLWFTGRELDLREERAERTLAEAERIAREGAAYQ